MHLESSSPCSPLAKDVHFDPNRVVCVAGAQGCENTHALPPLVKSHGLNSKAAVCAQPTPSLTGIYLSGSLSGGAKMQRGCVEIRRARFSKLANRPLCKVVCLQMTTARCHRLHNAAEQADAAASDICKVWLSERSHFPSTVAFCQHET